jgi:cytochrome c-type biogenesis protein CcmE
VDELLANPQQQYTNVRVSGAVLGDTIQYDSQNQVLTFTIANIPGDNKEIEALGGLAKVLHDAAVNPSTSRLKVEYHNVKPDLLKNEAQAIVTGNLGVDGVFYAEELLLKCPSRYEDSLPEQAQN